MIIESFLNSLQILFYFIFEFMSWRYKRNFRLPVFVHFTSIVFLLIEKK